ncbi:hypothetical protein FRX31_019531 [Thalictrum thalictroides]|uniref:Uncharacterized protein n=1 Tax=Thalictrum thalictroides TaxID=46969 RepID=A0A7J6W2W6_THATH|nr:hypothetical protein FRX31_019531 [Thalictrum thalictroides]
MEHKQPKLPKKRKEKPPGGYGVHTFEDETQYIRLPGWKRGKYFDPRSVQASQTNTGEGIQTSQVSTQASRISIEDYYHGNQPSETTTQPSTPGTIPSSSRGGNATSTWSGKAGSVSSKGTRATNAPTSAPANVGNIGARTVNGANTRNLGARPGNGAKTGTNGTTIQSIGPPKPQSKPPTKPKPKTTNNPISQRTRSLDLAAGTSTRLKT